MGTLTTNLGLNKPTPGGDSGGNSGTDAGGWPQLLNDNFDYLDALIYALQQEIVVFPANQVIVLDRSVSGVSVSGTTSEGTLYSRSITPSEILGRALRVELLGEVSNPGTGFFIELKIEFGGQVLWAAKIPVDFTSSIILPLELVFKLIPVASDSPRAFGHVMLGADGGDPISGFGDPYGAIPASSAISSSNGVVVDMTVAQTLAIKVTPSDTFVQVRKVITTVIRE